MKNIALIGAGGHAKVIQDVIRAQGEYRVIAIFDDKYSELLRKDGLYHGPIASITELQGFTEFQVIITIGNNVVRKRIVDMLDLPVERYATIIHPSSIISKSASIGAGTVVMPCVVVNADTKIGQHVILNTSCVVEHDNNIADFVHISPRAVLTGAIHIEEGTQIGAGASIIPGISISSWSMVGAGAVVIRDVPSRCTAVGNPARFIRPSMT